MKFAFSSFFSPFSLVGVDLRPGALCLVQVQKRSGSYLVREIARDTLPADVFFQGKIKQWEKVEHLLQALVQRNQLQGLAAAIILPANLVCMERITLPLGMSEQAIENEITLHLQKGVISKQEALAIDFSVDQTTDATSARVFFAAVRAADLQQYVQCVNAAGLQTKIVDIDIYALHRVLSQASPFLHAQAVHAILHVVNQAALLLFFNQQEIIFQQHFYLHTTDFVVQIKNKIEQSLALFAKVNIDVLLVCACSEYLQQLAGLSVRTCVNIIHAVPLPTQLQFATAKDRDEALAFLPHWIMACGAAMREVKKW